MARCVGARDEEVDGFVFKPWPPQRRPRRGRRARRPGDRAEEEGEGDLREEERPAFSGFLPAAAKPFELPEDRAAQVALGEQFGAKEPRISAEIAAIRQEIYKALQAFAPP
jgi:hypothetical protein